MKYTKFKLTLALAASTAMMAAPIYGKEVNIKLVHTNDIHSRVEDDGKSVIGFAKFTTYVDQVREQGNTLVLDAGDMIQGLPFGNLEKGHSLVELANAVGYDAMTTGNHEFDFGASNLLEVINKLNFPTIAANFYQDGKPVLETYIVKEFEGVKVGIFGMATEETAFKSHSKNTEGYTFEDMIASAKEQVNILKEQENVDIVIMLAHLGLDEGDYTSDLVAKAVDGIDLIVDGHSHTMLEQGRQVGDTLIVSTGEYFEHIGEVEITYDDETEDLSLAAKLLSYEDFTNVEPNQEVLDMIATIKQNQESVLKQVVGQTKVNLIGERENVRTGETNLGQLACKAMQKLTNADMVLTNGGGIRASIPAGDITMNDLVTVFPYGNVVVVKELTGQEIKEALELGVSEYPAQKGAFPHTAGLTFTLNAYEEVGNRISDLTIGGVAVDLNKTYTVATNDFVASGGDGYTMFANHPVAAEYNTLMDALMDYIKEVGVVEDTFVPTMKVVTEAPVQVETSEEVVADENKTLKLRSALEDKGFKVAFDNTNKMVEATNEKVTLQFTVGSTVCTILEKEDSKKAVELDSAIQLVENTSYIMSQDLESVVAAYTA